MMMSKISSPVAEPLFVHVTCSYPSTQLPRPRQFSGALQILSSGQVHLAVLRMDWQADLGLLLLASG